MARPCKWAKQRAVTFTPSLFPSIERLHSTAHGDGTHMYCFLLVTNYYFFFFRALLFSFSPNDSILFFILYFVSQLCFRAFRCEVNVVLEVGDFF